MHNAFLWGLGWALIIYISEDIIKIYFSENTPEMKWAFPFLYNFRDARHSEFSGIIPDTSGTLWNYRCHGKNYRKKWNIMRAQLMHNRCNYAMNVAYYTALLQYTALQQKSLISISSSPFNMKTKHSTGLFSSLLSNYDEAYKRQNNSFAYYRSHSTIILVFFILFPIFSCYPSHFPFSYSDCFPIRIP